MKILYVTAFFLMSFSVFSQNPSEVSSANKTVKDFFIAFHAQDSVALMQMVHPEITLKSIAENDDGTTTVKTEKYADLVKSIGAIPKDTQFEERLHSFDTRVNGSLATVVSPYTFYLNGKLSHCGVDSFELVKEENGWKIVSIIDTRKKEGCK